MSGNIIVIKVVSCPPCILDVDVKTPAGLLMSVPLNHSSVVESMNSFIGAAMLPK